MDIPKVAEEPDHPPPEPTESGGAPRVIGAPMRPRAVVDEFKKRVPPSVAYGGSVPVHVPAIHANRLRGHDYRLWHGANLNAGPETSRRCARCPDNVVSRPRA